MALWLSGCASHSSAYKESFSEIHLSADFKKVLVVGSDKYSYVFDVPDPLASVMKSPLRGGVTSLFPNDGQVSFKVGEDGTIRGSFYVVLPDSFFQGREDMKQVAESIGFSHGRLYSIRGRIGAVRDGNRIPRYVGWSDADVEKYTKELGGVYFLPLSISGRRFADEKLTTMQGADNHKMDRRHTVVVIDNQTERVDLLGPTAVVTGAGICIATLPVCFVAALPVMGMKP